MRTLSSSAWYWLLSAGAIGSVALGVARQRWRQVPTPDVADFLTEDLHAGELVGSYDDSLVDDRPICSKQLVGGSADEGLTVGVGCLPPAEWEPQGIEGIPMAQGTPERWPVITKHPSGGRASYFTTYVDPETGKVKFRGIWGREFGAVRKSKKTGKKERHHAGVDLAAYGPRLRKDGRPLKGDVVVAAAPGELFAILPFYNGTDAIYQRTDDGLIINYGEVDPSSSLEFLGADAYKALRNTSWATEGLQPPAVRVLAGEPIARIGHHIMLHMEIYRKESDPAAQLQAIRKEHYRWLYEELPPDGLLDPTEYLVKAELAQGLLDDAPTTV